MAGPGIVVAGVGEWSRGGWAVGAGHETRPKQVFVNVIKGSIILHVLTKNAWAAYETIPLVCLGHM